MGYSIGMRDFGEGIGKYTGRVFAGGILFILLFLLIGLSTLILFVIPVLNIVAAIGIVVAMLLVSVFERMEGGPCLQGPGCCGGL